MENSMSNISVNIKDQRIKEVDRLAEHLDRTRSWIINDALDEYVAKQEGLLASIRQSLRRLMPIRVAANLTRTWPLRPTGCSRSRSASEGHLARGCGA
jgi:hypothetical protein